MSDDTPGIDTAPTAPAPAPPAPPAQAPAPVAAAPPKTINITDLIKKVEEEVGFDLATLPVVFGFIDSKGGVWKQGQPTAVPIKGLPNLTVMQIFIDDVYANVYCVQQEPKADLRAPSPFLKLTVHRGDNMYWEIMAPDTFQAGLVKDYDEAYEDFTPEAPEDGVIRFVDKAEADLSPHEFKAFLEALMGELTERLNSVVDEINTTQNGANFLMPDVSP